MRDAFAALALTALLAGCTTPQVKYKRIPAEEYLMREEVPVPPAPRESGPAIRVSLEKQRVWLYLDGVAVLTSVTCTGRPGFESPTGTFRVISKHRDWISTIYKVPMPYFLRLDAMRGRIGLHQGIIALTPASHGCIRVPKSKAEKLFDWTPIGTPVVITGSNACREEQNTAEMLAER